MRKEERFCSARLVDTAVNNGLLIKTVYICKLRLRWNPNNCVSIVTTVVGLLCCLLSFVCACITDILSNIFHGVC